MLKLTAVAGGWALGGCEAYNQAAASLVSPEQEAKLGAQAFQEIKGEVPRLQSGSAQERVSDIAARIVPASGSKIPFERWEVVVFDSDEVNAFALPGGHIGVYRGILELAESDAEIATVMGHEVAHVNARHAAQRIGTSTFAGLGEQALNLGGQAYGLPPQLVGLLGGATLQYGLVLPYSRGQELEADSLGLTYMAKAGYDPSAAVGFWQSMAAQGGGATPAFLSTHPSGGDRIAEIQERLPEAEAIYRQSTG